jgi:hypothetical protein
MATHRSFIRADFGSAKLWKILSFLLSGNRVNRWTNDPVKVKTVALLYLSEDSLSFGNSRIVGRNELVTLTVIVLSLSSTNVKF